ncbi:hypothetical protein JCM8097_000511 [Rhodosporidiobolus ruineniae]
MTSLAPPSRSTALPARSTSTTLSAGAPTANTATAGQDELWSGILNSVKGSKSVQTKQAFVLGAPGSGKRTLLSRLRTTTGDLPSTSSSGTSSNGLGKGKDAATHEERRWLDLGLSCEVLDVRDEGDEGETLARLSLFRLPSPAPPFPSLLSLALTPQTLLDSLVVLVLDWERPWRFVEELEGWVGVLEERLGRKRGEREGWEEVEGRERLESYLRSYHEPPAPGSSSSTAALATSSSSATAAAAALDPDAPLPPGTLTDNLGIGLVIVCTKADQMNALERDREFNDEQFDYIQQTLRTVALRYGAAVFYTSQTNPSSYAKLREYLLHRLFSAPSSSSALAPSSGIPASPTSAAPPAAPVVGAPGAASASTAFPFPHRANVIDRDAVLVPTGWDSWGKIRILRERFECESVGEGFAADVAWRLGRERDGEEEGGGRGLRREYEQVVVDFEGVDQPLNLAATVSPLDEQSFLSTHYETLQADAAKDPRLAFRQQPSSSSSSLPSSSSALAPSVVGPMAGSTLELPTVVSTLERARERASGGGGGEGRDELGKSTRAGRGGEVAGEAFARGMSRQNSQTSTSARSPPLPSSGHSPSLSSSLLQRTASSSGPSGAASPPSTAPNGVSSGGAGTAAGAAGGNQVLADFFQSLLTARTAGGAAAGSGTNSPTATAGAAGLGASARRPAEGGEK